MKQTQEPGTTTQSERQHFLMIHSTKDKILQKIRKLFNTKAEIFNLNHLQSRREGWDIAETEGGLHLQYFKWLHMHRMFLKVYWSHISSKLHGTSGRNALPQQCTSTICVCEKLPDIPPPDSLSQLFSLLFMRLFSFSSHTVSALRGRKYYHNNTVLHVLETKTEELLRINLSWKRSTKVPLSLFRMRLSAPETFTKGGCLPHRAPLTDKETEAQKVGGWLEAPLTEVNMAHPSQYTKRSRPAWPLFQVQTAASKPLWALNRRRTK